MYMYICMFPACVSMHYVCAWCLWKPEESVRLPGSVAVGTREPPYACWKLTCVLWKKSSDVSMEPSLQHPFFLAGQTFIKSGHRCTFYPLQWFTDQIIVISHTFEHFRPWTVNVVLTSGPSFVRMCDMLVTLIAVLYILGHRCSSCHWVPQESSWILDILLGCPSSCSVHYLDPVCISLHTLALTRFSPCQIPCTFL